MNALFTQAIVYTAAAFIVIGGSTWFLYFSPMKTKPAEAIRPGKRLTEILVAVLGLAVFLMAVGALWDAAMHVETGTVPGGSDFLWPPHIMIYTGFLLAFLSGLAALGKVAITGWNAGLRDPRAWVRMNPRIGAVALTSFFTLLSAPGDALWHELFGIDLTAWSPPHVLMALMSATILVSAAGLLLQAHAAPAGSRAASRNGAGSRLGRDLALTVLFGLMLNVTYIIGVLEWELPEQLTFLVATRPVWLYPVVGGVLVFVSLFLAKMTTSLRWAATLTAVFFYIVRLGATFVLDWSGTVAPLMPLWFILGALAMDALPWKRMFAPRPAGLAMALAFSAGYLALAPGLLVFNPHARAFSLPDGLLTALLLTGLTALAALVLLPFSRSLAGRRAGHVPEEYREVDGARVYPA